MKDDQGGGVGRGRIKVACSGGGKQSIRGSATRLVGVTCRLRAGAAGAAEGLRHTRSVA